MRAKVNKFRQILSLFDKNQQLRNLKKWKFKKSTTIKLNVIHEYQS